jgi:hypothetical protein
MRDYISRLQNFIGLRVDDQVPNKEFPFLIHEQSEHKDNGLDIPNPYDHGSRDEKLITNRYSWNKSFVMNPKGRICSRLS